MTSSSDQLEKKPCKAGCDGCFYDDKECPFDSLSKKEFSECECIKENIIYVKKEAVNDGQ